jgi:hypothetical protein
LLSLEERDRAVSPLRSSLVCWALGSWLVTLDSDRTYITFQISHLHSLLIVFLILIPGLVDRFEISSCTRLSTDLIRVHLGTSIAILLQEIREWQHDSSVHAAYFYTTICFLFRFSTFPLRFRCLRFTSFALASLPLFLSPQLLSSSRLPCISHLQQENQHVAHVSK